MLTPVPIDIETTGKFPSQHVMLEFAMLLVTPDLDIVGDFGSRVLHASEHELSRMDAFVTNMHAQTGLTDLVRTSTLTVAELDHEVTGWLALFGHQPHSNPLDRTAIILGSSCRLDMNFIEAQMPQLTEVLHYRMLDVSSTREQLLMWEPELVPSAPFEIALDDTWTPHRASSDIRWTLEEARGLRTSIKMMTSLPF
jgi:oligoribonuclease